MKKNVLVFGLIAGLIVSAVLVIAMGMNYNNPDFEGGMIVGYASQLVAFAFVFVGIKNYRDKHNGGIISFGKAFKIGFLIAFIASTMYVVAWLIELYGFMPDFMEKYTGHYLQVARNKGVTGAEYDELVSEMKGYADIYKNPLGVILFTYVEVLPLGIVVTLISALILKRKSVNPEAAAV